MRISLSVLVPLLLGCAGLLGEPEDSGAADTGSAEDTEEQSGKQTQSCRDYIDCLDAADADELDDAEDRYGPNADCWTSGDTTSRACDDACESGLKAAESEYPDVEECGGTAVIDTGDPDDTGNPDDTDDTGNPDDTDDTGNSEDTGTSTGPSCPLDDGSWLWTLRWTKDDCGIGSFGTTLDLEVVCTSRSRGEFSVTGDFGGLIPLNGTCSGEGSDFVCAGADGGGFGVVFELAGSANGSGTTADGAAAVGASGGECVSTATFTAELN